MNWILILLGLKYPDTDYALNEMSGKCVAISSTSYVVKSKEGFADAVNKEVQRRSRSGYATNVLEQRSDMLAMMEKISFPAAIFFSDSQMDSIKLDYDQSELLD